MDEAICHQCRGIFQLIEEPRCKKCSKPIELQEIEYCYDCSKKQHSFEFGYALWIYDKNTRRSFTEFKYKGRREYSNYYVAEIKKQYGERITSLGLNALIPIPLHKSKARYRGFNQAAMLANGIGEQLQIPVREDILLRNRKTIPQKELSNKERCKNLMEAFYVNARKIQEYGLRDNVMLIDDIYTTGSTIEACTQVLQMAGIKKIYFFSVCIGKGF